MKRTIYHSELDNSKGGRTMRALFAILTKNRYSLIMSWKITIVKRNYQERRMRQRVLNDLYIVLIFAPIIIPMCLYFDGCSNKNPMNIENDSDSVLCAPSVVVPTTITHPHTHFEPLQ